MNYQDLPNAGYRLNATLDAVYERAAAAHAPRPIAFEIWNRMGAMRIYQSYVKVWLPRSHRAPQAVLAHELAHAIIAKERASPRLHPEQPTGVVRMILSDLISLTEHQVVHELLDSYGLTPHDDAEQRNHDFLAGIPRAPLDAVGQNVHLATGYATMLTIYAYEPLRARVVAAMREKSSAAADLGLALAGYVQGARATSLEEDARALMTIAQIAPHLQACVFSVAAFERAFGWS